MKKKLTKQDILELLEKQSKEFHRRSMETDKKIGELAGTWGKFVTEMVKPKIVEIVNDDKFKPKEWKVKY
ncbi:MAG: hypothetical protein HY738_07790 [Bacteroidia bacterium]|nr:hypothetical protein [Bacteroidia bacterium]